MSVLLRILDGPQAGSSLELREGQRVLLGRGDEADLRVLDSWASRLHCAVACRPDGVFVEDLNTKNGTYVNGKQVDKARVADGSLIQLGTTTVQVLVHATQRTVVASVSLPLRSKATRLAITLASAALILAGVVFGALFLFGPREQASSGGKGVTWESTQKGGGGFSLFGGSSRATLDITSEPAGASVFIDEDSRGVTPLQKLEATVGEHALRVQKAGYQVHRAPLKIEGRSPEPVHVVLKPTEHGVLVVASKPDGASVHLDGEYRGNTPLRLEDLEPQTYSLRLSKTNFADWSQEVTLKPKETLTVEAVLGHREVAYYEAELKKDPNNVSYHCEVAHLYLLEHNEDACFLHLGQAIEITSTERDTSRPQPYADRLLILLGKIYFNDHFTYGDATFVQKMQARLDALLGELAGKQANSSFIEATANRLYKRAGTSVAEKAQAFEARAKAQPADLAACLNAVGFLLLAGEHSRAEARLQATCAANSDDPKPLIALGRFYIGARKRGVSGAKEKAIQALNAALQKSKIEEEKAEVRRLLGEASG